MPIERIVYAYAMHLDDVRISVSRAPVEFKIAGAGTLADHYRAGTFPDGDDDAGKREHGTPVLLDQLGVALQRALIGG